MICTESIAELRQIVSKWKKEGLTIGLVPTMGYLHNGHKSLIEKARLDNDKVVVSIFVNPIQFGPNEDFDKYPRDIENDTKLSNDAGASLIFAPTVDEMYPTKNLIYIDVDELGNGLCGKSRPNHFRGVCTVVAKLFNIIMPDRAYFGEKDAQQLAIIKKMVRDFNFNIDIVPCPIIREHDGLALSSRNIYLSIEERNSALIISKSLNKAKMQITDGERNADIIRQTIIDKIQAIKLARIDYVEVVNAETLEPISEINVPILAAVAVYIGKTRLIDNFTFREV